MEFNAQLDNASTYMCLSQKTSFANWIPMLVSRQNAMKNDSKLIWDLNESTISC